MMDRLRKPKMDFTMVPNALICSPDLSAKAKIVYIYLVSKPDDWKFYTKEIVKHMKESLKTVRLAINELISFGWLDRKQVRNEKGLYSHSVYTLFYDVSSVNPKSDDRKSDDRKSDDRKSDDRKSDDRKSDDRLLPPTNTNKTNTNKTNTDINSLSKGNTFDGLSNSFYRTKGFKTFRKEFIKTFTKQDFQVFNYDKSLILNLDGLIMEADTLKILPKEKSLEIWKAVYTDHLNYLKSEG